MTNKEVMVQIISEVTGQSKEDIRLMLAGIEASDPNIKRNFEEKLTPNEANALLDGLRKEKQGILAWFVAGVAKSRK